MYLVSNTNLTGGKERYDRRIIRTREGAGVENAVVFTGTITGEDKLGALQDSDCFILPSYSENFGMAVVEAMYFKLPVVVTESVGIAPMIKEHNAGIVIEKDTHALKNAILEIMQKGEASHRMGAAGKKLVEEEFMMPRIADKWIEAYHSLSSGSVSS